MCCAHISTCANLHPVLMWHISTDAIASPVNVGNMEACQSSTSSPGTNMHILIPGGKISGTNVFRVWDKCVFL
jgi:hypothetical protein